MVRNTKKSLLIVVKLGTQRKGFYRVFVRKTIVFLASYLLKIQDLAKLIKIFSLHGDALQHIAHM